MFLHEAILTATEAPQSTESVPVDLSSAGVAHDHVPAMDAAALTMIGLLFFMLACVGYAAWRLHRRSKRPSPLDGLEEDDPAEQGKPKSSEWERDPDWWRR